jgi:hypothetical protein
MDYALNANTLVSMGIAGDTTPLAFALTGATINNESKMIFANNLARIIELYRRINPTDAAVRNAALSELSTLSERILATTTLTDAAAAPAAAATVPAAPLGAPPPIAGGATAAAVPATPEAASLITGSAHADAAPLLASTPTVASGAAATPVSTVPTGPGALPLTPPAPLTAAAIPVPGATSTAAPAPAVPAAGIVSQMATALQETASAFAEDVNRLATSAETGEAILNVGRAVLNAGRSAGAWMGDNIQALPGRIHDLGNFVAPYSAYIGDQMQTRINKATTAPTLRIAPTLEYYQKLAVEIQNLPQGQRLSIQQGMSRSKASCYSVLINAQIALNNEHTSTLRHEETTPSTDTFMLYINPKPDAPSTHFQVQTGAPIPGAPLASFLTPPPADWEKVKITINHNDRTTHLGSISHLSPEMQTRALEAYLQRTLVLTNGMITFQGKREKGIDKAVVQAIVNIAAAKKPPLTALQGLDPKKAEDKTLLEELAKAAQAKGADVAEQISMLLSGEAKNIYEAARKASATPTRPISATGTGTTTPAASSTAAAPAATLGGPSAAAQQQSVLEALGLSP